MRYPVACIWLGASLLLFAGCGGPRHAKRVPDVRGERLDVAERHLEDAGLDFEELGGGTLGVIVRSNWTVCDQEPAPEKKAKRVRLIVGRDCPSPPPVAAPHVVPDLYGENLEDAEERLEALDIADEVVDEDDDEVVVPHLWTVCDQDPAPGETARFVTLYAEHLCE